MVDYDTAEQKCQTFDLGQFFIPLCSYHVKLKHPSQMTQNPKFQKSFAYSYFGKTDTIHTILVVMDG